MSDSGGRSPFAQAADIAGETLMKPVTDEIGQALEQGISDTFNIPKPQQSNPADQQKQQLEKAAKDQKVQQKIQQLNWYIDRNRKVEEEVKQVREAREQLWKQKQEEERQKAQVKPLEELEKTRKPQKFDVLAAAKAKAETRRGVGG